MSSIHYFTELQKRLGASYKTDPSTLSDEALLTLGKAVAKEHNAINSGGPSSSSAVEKHHKKLVKAIPEDPDGNVKRAYDLSFKIRQIGYSLIQVGAPKDQRQGLWEECWHMHSQIVNIAAEYDGDLKALWDEFVDYVKKEIHWWSGDFDGVNQWLAELRREHEKRQPGYKEPTKEDLIEMFQKDGGFGEEEEFPYDVGDDYSDADGYIDTLEEAIHERDQSHLLLQTSYDRLERIALGKEKASEAEILKMREDHQNITSGKYVNNARWKPEDRENIRLLTQVAKPEGHSFPIHFKNNHHFLRNLILRYGIDITHRQSIGFNCTRLAWANNYWGTIRGYEDKGEVIIALWVNQQNKGEARNADLDSDDAYDYFYDYNFDAKSTFIAKQHGDKFLELERRHAPLSADFTGYNPERLMEAHKLIMRDLKND